MDLHVVALARVEVDVERAVLGEQAAGVAQARGEEADVVLERVGVGQRADLLRAVAPPLEAGAIPLVVGHDAQRPAALLVPGVERRVDVDDVERAVGQAWEDVEVVAVDEQVVVERHPRRKFGGSDELHAHDVMDTPGCGRVRPVGRSSVHARRRIAAMALLTLLGAALVVALDRRYDEERRRARWARAWSAAWPRPSPSPTCPPSAPPTSAAPRSGLSHVLYAKSPGGVVASAQRTAHWRPIIDRVAKRHGLDAGMLEAIVMLESAGRADARASDDLRSAAGLTQILAETGQNLLGLHIDVKASERLTRGILRGRRVRQREALRRRVDERFDPAKAIEATARYLDFAKGKLGRDDLAVVSYHMGVGNLQQALTAYGKGIVPYAQLYFDSSPLRHAAAWRKLASLGDDSSTYLWRVLAAREIMRLYRSDPSALEREAVLQSHKASAEEVLHPPERTTVFGDPFAVGRARASGALRAIDATVLEPYGLRIDSHMGELARRVDQSPRLYRALRPQALAMLQAIGAATQAIGGTPSRWWSRARCATSATSACSPRPTARPRPPTRCTPPASPSTSPATTAAAPRRSPSSSSSTASRRGASSRGCASPGRST